MKLNFHRRGGVATSEDQIECEIQKFKSEAGIETERVKLLSSQD